MAKPFNIQKFNSILSDYGQSLKAIKITGQKIMLSNGVVLSNRLEISRCKNRIMHGHDIWKNNFDMLYNIDPNIRREYEKKCRAKTSQNGGEACQKLHREKIVKNNLFSTGIPFQKGNISWNKGLTKENNASLRKLSESRKGQGNPMYGFKMTEEQKQQKSKLMKEKILSGKFTPKSNNRNTHWDALFNGRKYSSSWEALFHSRHPRALYEELRISYNYMNEEFVYIDDFVDHHNMTVAEVKPKELCSDLKTQAKLNALKKWAIENSYKFILVDKKYLQRLPMPDLSKFDESTRKKIEKLYEINKKNCNQKP